MNTVTREVVAGVAKISETAAAELYRRAFDLVAPKSNWKAEVNAYVERAAIEYDADVICDAVEFMTGSKCEYMVTSTGLWFHAAGYYAAVGA